MLGCFAQIVAVGGPLRDKITDAGPLPEALVEGDDLRLEIGFMTAHRTNAPVKVNDAVVRGDSGAADIYLMPRHFAPDRPDHFNIFNLHFRGPSIETRNRTMSADAR
jgi:hypothetical protein